MNIIRDYSTQIREAFLTLPMASRVIAILLAALVAIGFGMLVQIGPGSAKAYLFGGRLFEEDEILKAEIAFSTAGLTDYEIVGNRIQVPQGSKDLYLRALSDGDAMPIGVEDPRGDALNKSNPFEASDQRTARMQHAREQKLAIEIMRFDEVKTASVQHSSVRQGFARTEKQSASVFVTPVGNDPLPRALIKEIQHLVSHTFAGMSPEEVHVTDANGNHFDTWDDNADPVARTKRRYELEYKRRIASLLKGYGEMQIETEVEINPDLKSTKTVLQYDTEPTTTREATQSYSSEPTANEPSGVPGVVNNAYGNQPASLSATKQTGKKVTQSTEQYDRLPGHEATQTETGGLQVTRVSASIALPQSYYQKIYLTNYLRDNPGTSQADVPPMADDELELLRQETENDVKNLVATILPQVGPGDDRFPLVSVHDYPDLPLEPLPEPSSTALVLGWLGSHWQSVGLLGVALIALLMVRAFARRVPSGGTSDFSEGFGLEIPRHAPVAAEGSNNIADANSLQDITGSNLKDDLAQMIDQNPDAAANVLRAWIGEAA